jgi:hypothetical protein
MGWSMKKCFLMGYFFQKWTFIVNWGIITVWKQSTNLEIYSIWKPCRKLPFLRREEKGNKFYYNLYRREQQGRTLDTNVGQFLYTYPPFKILYTWWGAPEIHGYSEDPCCKNVFFLNRIF